MNSLKEIIIKNGQEIDRFKEKYYKTNRISIQFNIKKEKNLHIKISHIKWAENKITVDLKQWL